ncbi:MAG: hypothetical protein Q4G08_09720 [Capnocytophaga sp.]|nr:hypothetical protein [Capnocytophaga sp.]
MVKFLKIILVSVFMAGTASTANTGIEKAVLYPRDCTGDFSECNKEHPAVYADFEDCMIGRGC